MPLVLLLRVEVLLGSLHHSLHVVSLIYVLTSLLPHSQSHQSVVFLKENPLKRCLSHLWFLVLNHQDIIIRCDLIEIDVSIELIDPFISIGDLQLKRSEHLIFIVDLLAIQPGVAVIELEHVQASLYGIH